jgi:hypothetical protein
MATKPDVKKLYDFDPRRRVEYDPSFPLKLFAHLAEGYSYETAPVLFMVSLDTMYEWEKRYPEYALAKRMGVAASQKYWEDLGRRGLLSGPKNFCQSVWIFSMKNRFKWRDNLDVDHTSKGEKIHSSLTEMVAACEKRMEEAKAAKESDDEPDFLK